MVENMRMYDLTSQQIKYKDILNKEFLELEIWAISDINPNRNKTHFTLDGMKKAVDGGLANKPIVGFFEKGDFVEHNGKVEYDVELNEAYWNVNTQYGERILGWIRESDPVEIVEKDGLNWIKFNCAICTTYCYQQVKRLLKDRSKRVSVEITVLKSEMREDGVEEILEFNLNGVTILGSKNGKAVIEAIPGAHASILEQLDNDVLEGQKKVLSFAYKNMENNNADVDDKNTEKEVHSSMVEEKQTNTISEDNAERLSKFSCPDCQNAENADDKDNQAQNEGNKEEKCAEESKEEKCSEGGCGDLKMSDNEKKEDDKDEDKEKDDDKKSEDDKDEDKDDDEKKDDEDYGCDGQQEVKCTVEELSAKCEQLSKQCDEYKCENEQLKAQLADKEVECGNYKSECEKFQDYSEIKTRMEEAEKKVHEYFCIELEGKAIAMMSGENIKEEEIKAVREKCYNGTYTCEEDIKKDVAYIVFNAKPVPEQKFSMPIINNSVVDTEQKQNKTMTREQRIAARCKSSK